MRLKVVMMLACALFLAGCYPKSGRIFKTFRLGDDQSVSRDASQSAIINHNPNLMTRAGTVTPARIVCTEPSPDVATVFASAAAAALEAAGKGAVSLTYSSSEALVQLAERTVAVQVLRERMFRACEAYSNGAITSTTYSVLMNRFDRAMVATLFGEVMGGAFGRALAAVGSRSDANASASLLTIRNAVADIEEAAEAVVESEKDLEDAQKALDKEKDKSESDEQKVANLSTARDKAGNERDDAQQDLRTHVQATTKAISDSMALTATGAVVAKAGPQTHAHMVDIFKGFIESNSLDDYIAACIVELERSAHHNDEAIEGYKSRLLSKLNKPIEPKQARALSVLEPLVRKSGLFDHCHLHLASLMKLRQQEIISSRLVGNQERIKEFDALGTIIDSTLETLPTVMLDQAKAKLPALRRARDDMNTLTLNLLEISSGDPRKEEKSKKNEEIKALNNKKATLIKKSDELISIAAEETSDDKRSELRGLESERLELRGRLQNATTERGKIIYEKELQIQFLRAQGEFDRYADILADIETKTTALKTHSKVMKAAGAK